MKSESGFTSHVQTEEACDGSPFFSFPSLWHPLPSWHKFAPNWHKIVWQNAASHILLVLACFGLFFHFLMLSMQFLLLASHFHFPSVLDLCVIFSVVAQPFLAFFLTTRLRTFVARLLSSQEDFFPHALPCMQRFRAFFMPLLLVSYLFARTQRKEAQCAQQTKTNQLVATHGGVTHKHAPCQRPFNKDLWK